MAANAPQSRGHGPAQRGERLLVVEDLSTWFDTRDGSLRAVDGVSFTIHRGETFALLGESGCGKSMTSLSLMRLVPAANGHIVAGRVLLDDVDLLALPEREMRRVRGGRLAMIFQEPMTSLNPVLTVGDQIAESVRLHRGLAGEALRRTVLELLDAVGIADSHRRYDEYPHQLSGGMLQRVMIAIALAGKPELLIADEPTTALDVTIQAQVLGLLRDLQRKFGMSVLLITHDLGVVAETADRVAVMYAGQIVEQAPAAAFFSGPAHPYSRMLFDSLPDADKRTSPLKAIPGSVPALTGAFTGCRFADRCPAVMDVCRRVEPPWVHLDERHSARCHLSALDEVAVSGPSGGAVAAQAAAGVAVAGPLLTVSDLKVHFPLWQGLIRRASGSVRALDGVDFAIARGRTLALVGESGCGKTTAGKAIMRLIEPVSGHIDFDGVDLLRLKGEGLRRFRTRFQYIFQDAYSSMNPRMRVGDIIAEGMITLGIESDAARRRARVDELLSQVGLSPAAARRYPHEFSGGQRQRICIARALATRPDLLICDEPTSALDISVQAQILNLLKSLQQETGIAYLFITHNLSVVGWLADEVAVMYLGRIVEQGSVDEVLGSPAHPYTQALLSAIPVIDPARRREVLRLQGDLPSPAAPPSGCHFHQRCPQVMEQCRRDYPGSSELGGSHTVRCFLYRQP